MLSLLLAFEQLFDGTLGDWKTQPVSFQLKEGAKPYHGQAFPMPKIHMKTLMREVQWLMELGVVLDFKAKTINLDSIILPMRDINNLQKAQKLRALRMNNSLAQELISTREATTLVVKILDANYQKADVRAIVETHCTRLTTKQKEQLLSLLLAFEHTR